MEPIRAPLTPDVELGLVVRLAAEAVDLVIFFRASTLVANVPELYRIEGFPCSSVSDTYSDIFFDILGVMLTQLPWNQLLQMSQPT